MSEKIEWVKKHMMREANDTLISSSMASQLLSLQKHSLLEKETTNA